jgi:predicted LPLAT superfamily acyltransferase
MSNGWTNQEERGTPFMLYLIRWIAMNLGRTTARIILYPITLYFLIFAPTARQASRNYLQRVSDKPVHISHIAKHIHHFSATILDRVFLLTGKFSTLDIQVHNIELIEKQLDSGNGCILLGSHIGSFEILRALAIAKHNLPVKVLMQEAHNEMITRILHSLNPDIADSVIQLGKPNALLKVHEYLQEGYLIGILGDRVVDSHKTMPCKVIGAEATLPTGPLLIASALKSPIVLFFGIYDGGNKYDIYFEEFADHIAIDRNNRDRDLHYWMQKYADRLTHHAKQSPYNWFNFYDFWKNNA